MKMNYRLLLSIFIFFVLCGCGGETQKNTKKQEKENLEDAIKKFNMAFATGDLEILDSLTTENYLHTNSSSKVIGKSDWFNYLKKRNAFLKSGKLVVMDYTLGQTKIEYHGSSAIVTGRVTVVAKDSLGTTENQYRITNLWVYKNGTWKRAGFHDGKIN